MIDGWVETDVEPPHRSDESESAFRDRCRECPKCLMSDLEPISGLSFVKCAACACPLKIVVHRYGRCPNALVPPPELL